MRLFRWIQAVLLKRRVDATPVAPELVDVDETEGDEELPPEILDVLKAIHQQRGTLR